MKMLKTVEGLGVVVSWNGSFMTFIKIHDINRGFGEWRDYMQVQNSDKALIMLFFFFVFFPDMSYTMTLPGG